MAMCVALNPPGDHIAVGFKSGHFKVFKYGSMEEICKNTDRKKAISQVRYSPDNTLLCVAAHDSLMYLYKV